MAKKIDVRCNKTGVIFDVSLKRLYVDDIKKLTNDQIAVLTSGDEVIKQDSSGHHTYVVSYKKKGTGLCLTYTDATWVETVSYDLIDGEWTYNSTDTGGSGGGGTTYTAGTGIDITNDTISIDEDVVALKSDIPSSSQLYTIFDVLDILNGKKLNTTKFKAFLTNLGVDLTTLTTDNLYAIRVSSFKAGSSPEDLLGIFGIALGEYSSSDISYKYTFGSVTDYTGFMQSKTLGELIDLIDTDETLENINQYFSIRNEVIENGQEIENFEYLPNIIYIACGDEVASGCHKIVNFNWTNLFACFDENVQP